MAEHFHALRVAEIIPETAEANSIRFEVPADLSEAFRFKAGQHLTLRADIEGWIEEWEENFVHLGDRPVDQPVWREGFDEMAWLDRGHALAELLGEHYPEHFVFCCAEKYVVCELAARSVSNQFRRAVVG